MELVREHLIYKDVPLQICFKKVTDHYEVIRCLLATRTNDVTICCLDSSNVFIQILVKKMGLQAVGCSATTGSATTGSSTIGVGSSNTGGNST